MDPLLLGALSEEMTLANGAAVGQWVPIPDSAKGASA